MKKIFLVCFALLALLACTPESETIESEYYFETVPQTRVSVHSLTKCGIRPTLLPSVAGDVYYAPAGFYECWESNDSVFHKDVEMDANAIFHPMEPVSWLISRNTVFHFHSGYVNVMDSTRWKERDVEDKWRDLSIESWRVSWQDNEDGTFTFEYVDVEDGYYEENTVMVTGRLVYCDEAYIIIDYPRDFSDFSGSAFFNRVIYKKVIPGADIIKAEKRLDGPCLLSMIPYTEIREDQLDDAISEEVFRIAVEGKCYEEGRFLAYSMSDDGPRYHVASACSYSWMSRVLGGYRYALEFTSDSVQIYRVTFPNVEEPFTIRWTFDSEHGMLILPKFSFSLITTPVAGTTFAKVRYVDDDYLILDIDANYRYGPDAKDYVVRLVLLRRDNAE